MGCWQGAYMGGSKLCVIAGGPAHPMGGYIKMVGCDGKAVVSW